jgi:DNA-binding transcriptional ArsR family regulator
MTALQASHSLTALADPTRQRIVAMLAGGALSSGEIAGRFELSAPAISQHLKTLKKAASRPSGTRGWMPWKRR